jgi:hypothetical protein
MTKYYHVVKLSASLQDEETQQWSVDTVDDVGVIAFDSDQDREVYLQRFRISPFNQLAWEVYEEDDTIVYEVFDYDSKEPLVRFCSLDPSSSIGFSFSGGR